MSQKLNIAIFGASGYTGAEAIRLALGHPGVEIAALTGESKAGQPIDAVYPHLAGFGLPDLVRIDDVSLRGLDAVFLCLPHATTQKVAMRLRSAAPDLRLIDLSADFRLRDVDAYESWYGEHFAPTLQPEARSFGKQLARRFFIWGGLLLLTKKKTHTKNSTKNKTPQIK